MEKKHNSKTADQKNVSKKNEDHLAPTPLKDQADSSGKSNKHKYISHEELKDKLDTYANLNEEKANYFTYKTIEKEYEFDLSKTEGNHNKADLNYSMGIRQHLPHSPHDDLKNDQERVKQNHRTKTADKAKEIYDKGQDNLRQGFANQKKEELNDAFDRRSAPKLKRKIGEKSKLNKDFKENSNDNLPNTFAHHGKDKERLRFSFDNGRAFYDKLKKKYGKNPTGKKSKKKDKGRGR